MNSVGEFEKRVRAKAFKIRVVSGDDELSVVRVVDLEAVLRSAKMAFPKKEAAVVLGCDGEEHSYETYDTEEVERWFCEWFGC